MASSSPAKDVEDTACRAAARAHVALPSYGAEFGADVELMRRVSLLDENGERRVRMGYLAVVASHKVNGISALRGRAADR